MTNLTKTTLNLSLAATLETTELFGVPVDKISECMLIDAAKSLTGHIAKLEELNTTLDSATVLGNIATLEKGMVAIKQVLDGDYKLAATAQGINFDLEQEAMVLRLRVFGVLSEDLTETNLTQALIELKERVKADKEINKTLDSKLIKVRITANNKSIKLLVSKLDALSTEA